MKQAHGSYRLSNGTAANVNVDPDVLMREAEPQDAGTVVFRGTSNLKVRIGFASAILEDVEVEVTIPVDDLLRLADRIRKDMEA